MGLVAVVMAFIAFDGCIQLIYHGKIIKFELIYRIFDCLQAVGTCIFLGGVNFPELVDNKA